MPDTTIASDRLYGIEFRPQEFDLYADALRFDLRSALMADDEAAVADRHWRLTILEAVAEIPAEDGLSAGKARTLRVLRCGWEVELVPAVPCAARDVGDDTAATALAVDRIAAVVNDLAQRAGFTGVPLGPEAVTTLLHRFRTGAHTP